MTEDARHLARELKQADESWRLLEEVRRRLTEHGDVAGALPGICEQLAASTGLRVAFVLVTGGGVDRVMACPRRGGRHGEAGIEAALSDDRSAWSKALWTSLKDGRELHLPDDLADRSGLPSGVGSAVIVPLSAPGSTHGALVAHSRHRSAMPPRTTAVLRETGSRVAVALERTELERNLAELEDANEAARFREELLAALSHDMQTPLAVLLGSIKALQAVDDLSPKHRAGLYESMGRRGAQLHRLVEQFLDYSRLEAGRPIEVRPAPTDVGAAVARIERDVGWRRPLEINVPDGLPRAFVDPDRLDQVLVNLMSNALKFSPVGSLISIRARATPDKVEIEVADRGPGMPPAELEHVFGKFYRGKGARGTAGTGLGLYVSRAVIEAQGGHLLAESGPDRGSRFSVVLPREVEES